MIGKARYPLPEYLGVIPLPQGEKPSPSRPAADALTPRPSHLSAPYRITLGFLSAVTGALGLVMSALMLKARLFRTPIFFGKGKWGRKGGKGRA